MALQQRRRQLAISHARQATLEFSLHAQRALVGRRDATDLIYRSSGAEKKSFLSVGDATRMSLADARDRAREADRLREQGSDPVQERKREERTQRERPTVAALLSAFVEAGENRKSDKTQAEYRRIVAAEIDGTPVGATTANDVTAPELDTCPRSYSATRASPACPT